ncbi:MAG: hypothetical protein GY940_05750 [bacterium]|nr:hypothetical protein [bacterium]
MDKREKIREKVDRTLEAMDHMEKLETGPYFYTRVEARLKNRRKQEARQWMPGNIFGRALRPVLMTLLLLLNVVSGIVFLLGPGQPAHTVRTEKTVSRDKPLQTYVSGLTQEYWQSNEAMDTVVTEKMIGSAE